MTLQNRVTLRVGMEILLKQFILWRFIVIPLSFLFHFPFLVSSFSLLFLSPFIYFIVQGVGGVLHYHKGSVSKALSDLFPDVNIPFGNRMSLFVSFYICIFIDLLFLEDWSEVASRRSFFERYAKENDFDPLLPENWYSRPVDHIMCQRVSFLYLCYYFIGSIFI